MILYLSRALLSLFSIIFKFILFFIFIFIILIISFIFNILIINIKPYISSKKPKNHDFFFLDNPKYIILYYIWWNPNINKIINILYYKNQIQ